MNLKRHGLIAGIALTATLALAACGSDNNETPNASGGGGASGTAGSGITCASGSLSARGSSAQKNAMDEWIKAYQQACSGAKIDYQGDGSGAGITAFQGGTADFAGSDSALKDGDETTKATARCGGNPALNLPMVTGPIAIAYNLDNVKDLRLKPETLAKVFSGAIKTWDDAAVKADNPGASLPSTPILAVHRADSSGTTENFTDYLTKTAASAWTFGKDKVWKAPGGQGEQKSDGVAAALKKSAGSIGYVEWSFAKANSLSTAKVHNGAGEYTALTGEAAGKTVQGAKITGTGDDLKLSIDYATKEAGAYPIILVTYEIVCGKGTPADKLALVKGFLGYTASAEGQKSLDKLGYAPLPETVRAKVETSIKNLA
ncbi:phosphate ABC transporter substrate-binding protein PstS [Dactylosporangium roseum]|uniref:Phosphate-binding protein n=1 Tax=Dactylosporangium roseum TaxID=47989 RepID=A0ABY5Z6H3_9ACTN|nr:phosphate ABC transporter substrate-binding protein PstS [Dactylosporangium roseum]UWZ37264.1 phosphate ABC transporter substrate-binding protein PstS [Dactylosporangium roseum]